MRKIISMIAIFIFAIAVFLGIQEYTCNQQSDLLKANIEAMAQVQPAGITIPCSWDFQSDDDGFWSTNCLFCDGIKGNHGKSDYACITYM